MTIENISKSYGDRILFQNVSFGIQDKDKIGVIGVNGTGKSTLLKIVAGAEKPETGMVSNMRGLRVSYLPQMPVFEQHSSVLQQVFRGGGSVTDLVRDYLEALDAVERIPEKTEWNQKLMLLSEKMDKADAWNLESEAKAILTKLGITEYDKPVEQLSGGQRKRVAMAGALIMPSDLLIIDEPTNHIDNETIVWLEKFLERYTGALLMVTHDRYFLDRVADRTLEIDKGKIYPYQANYSKFLEMKAEREEMIVASERKRQNFIRRELEWVRRGAQARSTKQKARLERFAEINAMNGPEKSANIEINVGSSRLGKKTIEINHLNKSYGGVEYIHDFSYLILKTDRIGIIGPNGCGKSTLLKCITGMEKPDAGSVEIGETVKIGIFTQENDCMDPAMRVIDFIKEIAEYVPTADGRISASQMLEKFLFSSDLQWSLIGKLSGGEKRRLYLLKILMAAPNILFLDEPTNDLDIETLTILEDYLDHFPGAVISVSHDRYFLDKVVDRIFAFEGNGIIKQCEGGYSEYAAKRETEENALQPIKEGKPAMKNRQDNREAPLRMSYKDQKEYESISDIIEALEKKVEETDVQIAQTDTDYVKLQELTKKREALAGELEEAMGRWVYLSELAEEIENNKRMKQRKNDENF